MKRSLGLLGLIVTLAAGSMCGGKVMLDSAGAGGCSRSGDCETDADCASGECVVVTECGFRACRGGIPEATTCTQKSDECCSTADCAVGLCFEMFAAGPICPPAGATPHNACVADFCASDADCEHAPGEDALCAPAGTFGWPVRACIGASCRTDGDCTEEPGGVCAPITLHCCAWPNRLACVYPSDGCRSDAECPGGNCGIEGTRASCISGVPICG